MEIKIVIEDLIKKALKDLKIEVPEKIELEHPDILAHGDYSCNVAMILAKVEKQNPKELAEQVLNKIEKNENIEKIEVAGPGFINFYLSKQFYADFLNKTETQILSLKGQKILLEHSSPNLFKPFHVGHLVNNSIGESLGRILKFSGAELKQVSYPSDISPGIAKTIWAIKKQNLDVKSLTLQQIADAYVLGTEEYKENKEEIDDINIDLYEKKDNDSWKIYQKGRELSLGHFQEITKKLGSEFSDLIFESEAEVKGKEIVQKNVGKVFKESQGAVIFEGSKHGLFDNVFVNSAGFGTYLAKDIGLLKLKFDKYNFDKSITITDVEQKQHFQLVKKAAEFLNPEWAKKSDYLQHGRMSFVGKAKMSSRYGNVPLVTEVLNKLEEKIKNDLPKESVEKISIAALKYTILKASAGKNIVFDLEKALDFSGDSGPYLQYAYVRANSIVEKSELTNDACIDRVGDISDLEKIIYRFPEEIEKSLSDFSPHHLTNYLYNLASEFNSFYGQTKILDGKNKDYEYNLALVGRFLQIMKDGLYLLGIETVERM